MGKNKLHHYAEVATFKNVIQVNNLGRSDFSLKGKWNTDFFKNDNPIVLELACGKGEYTIGLAQLHPDKNFIGIDVKGARIWRGAKTALEQGLSNVGFLRVVIDWLPDFFAANEISEIWITFPDPYLSTTKEQKRLTSPSFISKYKQVLKADGTVNLKTDDDTLHQFTLEVIAGNYVDEKQNLKITTATLLQNDNDIYAHNTAANEVLNIKTYYEGKHLKKGRTIKYLKFKI